MRCLRSRRLSGGARRPLRHTVVARGGPKPGPARGARRLRRLSLRRQRRSPRLVAAQGRASPARLRPGWRGCRQRHHPERGRHRRVPARVFRRAAIRADSQRTDPTPFAFLFTRRPRPGGRVPRGHPDGRGHHLQRALVARRGHPRPRSEDPSRAWQPDGASVLRPPPLRSRSRAGAVRGSARPPLSGRSQRGCPPPRPDRDVHPLPRATLVPSAAPHRARQNTDPSRISCAHPIDLDRPLGDVAGGLVAVALGPKGDPPAARSQGWICCRRARAGHLCDRLFLPLPPSHRQRTRIASPPGSRGTVGGNRRRFR